MQDSRKHRNQELKALIMPIEGSQHNWRQTVEFATSKWKGLFFPYKWNCWNKFCIATLIFNNNTSSAEIAETRIWKECVAVLLSYYEKKKVCAKVFKPLHVQEQIPIIDLGWVTLSLLFIRSCWSKFFFYLFSYLFIFYISPQQNKQKHTFWACG